MERDQQRLGRGIRDAARAEVYVKALDPATGWMRQAAVRRLEDLEPER
jgi:hypothetical protein